MKAMLVCVKSIFVKDVGTIPFENMFEPYGWAGNVLTGPQWIGNVFAEKLSTLDAIAADPRTEFSFPIDISGKNMAYDEAFEVSPATQGKIIAWAAQQWGSEFGQEVAANAKSRRYVAEKIMRKAGGVPSADPLYGWRVYW